MIKLEWFEALEALQELKTLGKVSEVLHIGQSALSMQLKKLTEALGVELFSLNGRYLILTDVGLKVLKQYQLVKAELKKVYEISHDYNALNYGKVSIVFTQATTSLMLAKINEFKLLYPGIQVEILTQNREQLLDTLNNYRCDLAILAGPPNDDSLSLTPVFPFKYVLALSKDNQFASEDTLSLAQLKGENFIVAEKASETEKVLIKTLGRSVSKYKIQYVSDIATAITAVKLNAGMSILPDISITDVDPNVAVVPLQELDRSGEYLILSKKEKSMSIASLKFIEFLTV